MAPARTQLATQPLTAGHPLFFGRSPTIKTIAGPETSPWPGSLTPWPQRTLRSAALELDELDVVLGVDFVGAVDLWEALPQPLRSVINRATTTVAAGASRIMVVGASLKIHGADSSSRGRACAPREPVGRP